MSSVHTLLADLRYGARAVRSRPTFTLIVVLTLAMGIGVNVAILSLAQQLLLRPLPVPEPERLVNLVDPAAAAKFAGRMGAPFPIMRDSDSGGADTVFSYPMFRDLEREQTAFAGLAAHTFYPGNVSTGGPAQPATLALVSGSYFPVLGLQPALGRLLGPEDDNVDGRAESVVLSYAFWQSELGGDPDVLGETLRVNGVPLTIVGVAPNGFHGTAVSARPSVFVPFTVSLASDLPAQLAANLIPNHVRRDLYWLHVFGRLAPGVTREAAESAMSTLYRAILSEVEAALLLNVSAEQREAFLSRPLVLEPGARGQTSDEILAPARGGLKLLLAVSGVVLLLCCANVAGLILLRTTTRSGEMAVRASLGATPRRLAALQLAESIVLALPAALLALPIAWAALRAARRVPGIAAAAPDAGLSADAALVAIGVAVAAALAVGLVPVRGLLRTEPIGALRAHGARQTTTKGVARFRTGLATAQVALSMALLATMGVFAQSLANIARLDLGADIDSIVMFSTARPDELNINTDPTFIPRLVEALEAIPGVTSVASSMNPLFSLDETVAQATVAGTDAANVAVSTNYVSPSFFETFGVALLAGRNFTANDDPFGVVIVNRSFAERFGIAPEAMVGRRIDSGTRSIATGQPALLEVVGVIGDLRSGKVTDALEPQVYFAWASPTTFYVRGTRSAAELMGAVRDAAARVAPDKPITNLQTMEQQFRANIAIERFFAGSSTAFAVLATALAALGLYGVLAYSVAQRSHEIGLRFALGAQAGRIRTMVLRQVLGIAVVGVAVGALVAAVVGRAARGILFDVAPGDPLVLAAAAALLTIVILGAAYVPARRATRVDPLVALRYE